jgi:choline dehydrogenase-like flavoprotein
VDYDPATRRVTGVKVVDSETREARTYTGRMVFLNAGCIATTVLMLNSTSDAYPTGIANASGQLGLNLIDHFGGASAGGVLEDFGDRYYAGRRPGGIYIPRYVNITENDTDFTRGFGFQGGAGRGGWRGERPGIGADFKEANRTPSAWWIGIGAFGEMLPNPNNTIRLHPTRRDASGMPVPVISCSLGPNEEKMMARASRDAKAMLEAAGAIYIDSTEDAPIELSKPGNKIHEMGTARMGRDPRTSVFNGWGQAHDIPNLFCSDGATMPSGACQNPSLTYMALSARAANHAADLAEQGAL